MRCGAATVVGRVFFAAVEAFRFVAGSRARTRWVIVRASYASEGICAVVARVPIEPAVCALYDLFCHVTLCLATMVTMLALKRTTRREYLKSFLRDFDVAKLDTWTTWLPSWRSRLACLM